MNDIRLTGLIGSNPLGALAAFGLLRICSEIHDLSTARLYWTQEYDWIAVLRVSEEIGKLELVEKLVAHQQVIKLDAFNWSNDIRVSPDEYRERLKSLAQKATLKDRRDADYFAAFGSEMISDRKREGLVKPTAFHMTSGQQKFLDEIRKLAESLKSDCCKIAFEEALFGPWQYKDKEHSLGWDPSAERLHALRYLPPTKDRRNRSVRAAIWLAIEALPLFPTAAVNGKLMTAGFTKIRPTNLCWPIWSPPIGLDTLRSLLNTSDNELSLKRRGVRAMYRSERSEFGKGYGILRPAIEY